MFKKLLITSQMRQTYGWVQKYIDNCNKQEGWNWLILSEFDLESRGNVKVIRTSLKDFADRIFAKTGMIMSLEKVYKRPVALCDFRPSLGLMFEDCLEGYDFWGFTDIDVVYGDLNSWLPDTFIKDLEIFTNDIGGIAGPFTLFKNNDKIKRLFLQHPNIRAIIERPDFYTFDEDGFSKMVVEMHSKGELIVEFRDWWDSNRMRKHGEVQRLWSKGLKLYNNDDEIMMYHFAGTKVYPTITEKEI